MDNAGSRRISVDIGGVDMDKKGDVSHISDGLPGTSGDISMVAMDKHAMRGYGHRPLSVWASVVYCLSLRHES